MCLVRFRQILCIHQNHGYDFSKQAFNYCIGTLPWKSWSISSITAYSTDVHGKYVSNLHMNTKRVRPTLPCKTILIRRTWYHISYDLRKGSATLLDYCSSACLDLDLDYCRALAMSDKVITSVCHGQSSDLNLNGTRHRLRKVMLRVTT